MKKYKNYIIAAGILILGIIIGNITSGDDKETSHKEDKHNYVQDPVTKLWTCSMHPQIKMEKPGNCPICGMELIPLNKSKDFGEAISSNEIVLSEEAIQLANIQSSKVVRSNAKKEIRLLGTIKPDERRLYSQVSHIPGRIERLYVNFTGEKIRRGQKIIRLYSPELISAQKELFEAMKSKDIYPQLFKATKNKLKLWKLTDKQINAIIKSGKVQEQIDILSDYSGYVMKRNVELGDHVMEGMKLFDIANIDKVWVMFDAYEADIPWIHNGDMVSFTVQAVPGKEFKGKVTYLDPFVTQKTRVAKVRVEINNRNHKLLPEMFANGIIKANIKEAKDALIIPKSAVLWTGKRAVVYVKVPHKKTISFVYREVILGPDLGEFYIVEKGLKDGEEIATNGVFRIDASAQLLGQKSMMNPEGGKVNIGGHAGMDMGGDDKKDKEMKKEDEKDVSGMIMIDKTKTDVNFKKQLGEVVDAYITLKDALTKDSAEKAQSQTVQLKKAISEVDMILLLGDAHNFWMKALKSINKNVETIQANTNIEEQRKAFGLLSKNLSDVVDVLGVKMPDNKMVYLEFCPMADDNKGSFWLSYDKEIANPFFGESMLQCGEVKKTFN
ncbi:MAG: efflux RND transporter periplasmic adaptor subunit [Flavobacteriaceae bacterium]|nr:efflux RND transporter periplasmic adaptor subunit [Flavobacteriaceae bacterium]